MILHFAKENDFKVSWLLVLPGATQQQGNPTGSADAWIWSPCAPCLGTGVFPLLGRAKDLGLSGTCSSTCIWGLISGVLPAPPWW